MISVEKKLKVNTTLLSTIFTSVAMLSNPNFRETKRLRQNQDSLENKHEMIDFKSQLSIQEANLN